MVKLRKIEDRVFQSKESIATKKKKMKQLTASVGLPEKMGELFLTEIKLSIDQANSHLRERAQLLGLL